MCSSGIARRNWPTGSSAPAQLGIFVRTKEPPDPHRKARVRPLVHFPLELKLPGPITLPPIPRKGRGRPAALTNARARMILALTCTGATVEVIAAAGGVTPSTLRSWLTRKDHEAYRVFQRAFAAAETYATPAALKAIMEGMHADPKIAFEFLARRHPDQWGKSAGQDGGDSGKKEGDAYVLPGVKADSDSEKLLVTLQILTRGAADDLKPMPAASDTARRREWPRFAAVHSANSAQASK